MADPIYPIADEARKLMTTQSTHGGYSDMLAYTLETQFGNDYASDYGGDLEEPTAGFWMAFSFSPEPDMYTDRTATFFAIVYTFAKNGYMSTNCETFVTLTGWRERIAAIKSSQSDWLFNRA